MSIVYTLEISLKFKKIIMWHNFTKSFTFFKNSRSRLSLKFCEGHLYCLRGEVKAANIF